MKILMDKPMKRPVRWYLLLSTWIFILSVLYPLHHISTFPLNLMALVGCFEALRYPFKESYIKNIYILFIHIAPFFWIPYDLSYVSITFALLVIIVYLIFILYLKTNPVSVYKKLLNEHHIGLEEFLDERFGIRGLFQP